MDVLGFADEGESSLGTDGLAEQVAGVAAETRDQPAETFASAREARAGSAAFNAGHLGALVASDLARRRSQISERRQREIDLAVVVLLSQSDSTGVASQLQTNSCESFVPRLIAGLDARQKGLMDEGLDVVSELGAERAWRGKSGKPPESDPSDTS